MAKTKISEFSATPGNNTDIDGINIAEGCAPSGINDAIRELMSQLKDFQAGTAGDSFNGPVGTTTAAAGAFTTLSSTGNTTLGDAAGDTVTVNGTATFANANPTLSAGTANGVAYLNGSKVLTTGSALVFDGSNLGIGTSSPGSLWSGAYQLVVGGGAGGAGATIYTSNSTAGTLAFADGTAGDAAYRGYVQYSHSTDSLVIGTGGTTKATLDSSGNLGLGVTPSAWGTLKPLEIGYIGNAFSGYINDVGIYATSNAYYNGGWKYAASSKLATRYSAEAGVHSWATAPSGTAGNAISFTQAMTLDASGRLGIGTTSPSAAYRLSLTGNGSSIVGGLALTSSGNTAYIGQVGAASADCEYWNEANGYVRFGTNSTERARITSGGALLLGSAVGGADERLWVETTTADWCIQTNSTGSGTFYHIGLRANGTQVGTITSTSTTTTYGTSSDYRLKENIQPMTGALAKVAALKPVTYKWKADGSDGEGFIAHELAEICPYAVVGEKDAVDENGNIEPQNIDTSFLVATLTAALQELNAKVEAQAAEIAALKGQA